MFLVLIYNKAVLLYIIFYKIILDQNVMYYVNITK